MTYRLLADAVVIVHLSFILFVLFGGFLAFRWRWVPWVHLPAAAWGALIEFGGWVCPLTPLENSLRRAGGAAGYTGGFVEHYVIPLMYPTTLTRSLQVTLGAAVILINGGIYMAVWRRRRMRAITESSEPLGSPRA